VGAPASFTLGRLAEAIGATLEGDAARAVTGLAPLETAGPDQVSFLTGPRYRRLAETSKAGVLVVPRDAAGLSGALLRVESPQAALITLLGLFYPEPPHEPGIHATAWVADGAQVHPTAAVGAGAVVERSARIGQRTRIGALSWIGPGAVIGDDVLVHPRVVVREGVRVGDRVILQPGVVLGADGFGYFFDGQVHRKIPQVGGVEIGDDVEIGANATVDRGTLGNTVIGRGTKIDNLVQVGHNTEVGEHAILVAQVGVSGSCRIGSRAILAGQVGVADHVTIGEGAVLTAKSGVPSDVPAGEVWSGTPSRPAAEFRRVAAAWGLLPELVRRVRALEKRLRELEGGRE
jgi:UDP-3-O-[3-hydroxymyristoyl] glucosamine N-acyltransferase